MVWVIWEDKTREEKRNHLRAFDMRILGDPRSKESDVRKAQRRLGIK